MEEIKSALSGKTIALNSRKSFFLLIVVAIFLLVPILVARAQVNTGIEEFGQYTSLASTDIRIIVAKIIRAFLGLLGIIALGFTIYGGYMYMTSEGNEEKVLTAKKILKNMAIGLAIILLSFSIVQFIINMLTGQYKPTVTEGVPGEGTGFCVGCGFLGSVIESHYPARDAVGIPRNTKIVITFKQKIRPETLIENTNGTKDDQDKPIYGDVKETPNPDGTKVYDYDQINSSNIKIYRADQGESNYLGKNPTDAKDDVYAFLTSDHKNLVLKPKEFLGDGINEYRYIVSLNDGILIDDGSTNGKKAFAGVHNYYDWGFAVSRFLDLTPPFVTSIIPMPSLGKYPRNILVQINFSEAVDPISASGIVSTKDTLPDFQNITASDVPGQFIEGEYKIGNQYRTVEFKTSEACGANPCGQPIFCLPSDAVVSTTVKSATINPDDVPQAVIGSNLYDGVVDLAGNSLNGGGEFRLDNGKYKLDPGIKTEVKWKEDKTLSEFSWKFSTSKFIDTTAPEITEINPKVQAMGIVSSTPWNVMFGKPMSIMTFNQLILKSKSGPNYDVWYTPAGQNFNKSGVDINTIKLDDCNSNPDNADSCAPFKTKAELWHGNFWQEPANSPAPSPIYLSFVNSFITDIFQNCYYPGVGEGSRCKKSPTDLNEMQPSCYDNTPQKSTSTCQINEICPLPQ